MYLGDAKIAASIGLVLSWTSWQALLTGIFAGFAPAAGLQARVCLAANQALRSKTGHAMRGRGWRMARRAGADQWAR